MPPPPCSSLVVWKVAHQVPQAHKRPGLRSLLQHTIYTSSSYDYTPFGRISHSLVNIDIPCQQLAQLYNSPAHQNRLYGQLHHDLVQAKDCVEMSQRCSLLLRFAQRFLKIAIC